MFEAPFIPISDEERCKCMGAIIDLNSIPHIKQMSVATIAETAGIKETKCRAVLIDLINAERVERFQVSENRRIQRYYYVVKQAGHDLLEEYACGSDS